MKYVKLRRGSKKPTGETWETTEDPDSWLASGNIGCLTKENGIVVVDFDKDIEAAREHWRRTLCEVIVKTKRGFHFYYSGETTTRKFEHGDIKATGYVVYPPSRVQGFTYEFIRQGNLKPFDESWFPIVETRERISEVIRGEHYIMHITASSGGGGHNATFRAACKLRDSGMDETSALAAMVEWNKTNADPPWTTKELLHKVRSAFKKGGKS